MRSALRTLRSVAVRGVRFHGTNNVAADAKTINIIFVKKDGTEARLPGKVGENLLRFAQRNDIELEGACECSLACSTCHVVFTDEVYDKLPEACEDEEDMLDMAFGLTDT